MKRNKKLYYLCLGMVLVSTMSSCVSELVYLQQKGQPSPSLTVDDARVFFEKEMSEINVTTRSGGNDRSAPKGVIPGDFTPQWNEAVTSENSTRASVDAPIITQYRYKVLRSEFKGSKSYPYEVEVEQRLVVMKNLDQNNGLTQYLLSLIPDRDFYAQNKGKVAEKFLSSGEKNGFTGVAIYSSPLRPEMPLYVYRYEAGKLIHRATTLGPESKRKKRIEKVAGLLSGMYLLRSVSSVQTRSGWEENYDWRDDSTQLDDLISLGCGTFSDGNTTFSGDTYTNPEGTGLYVDVDGDGIPDKYYDYGLKEPDTGGNDDVDDSLPVGGTGGSALGEIENGDLDGGGDNNSGGASSNNGDEETEDEKNTQIGLEGISKMEADLKSGNVQIKQVKMTTTGAVLTAAGVGLDTNGIIMSCLNFLDQNKLGVAKTLGNGIGVAGLVVSTAQTVIAFNDGEITTKDWVQGAATALGAISQGAALVAFIPGAAPVALPISGVAGVTGCVLGLISNFLPCMPGIYEIIVPGIGRMYIIVT